MTPEQMILWVAFNVLVLGMFALDLLVFHRKAYAVSLREALFWSVVWIALALIFKLEIYYFWGSEKALEFLTGYLMAFGVAIFLIIEGTKVILRQKMPERRATTRQRRGPPSRQLH